jgi:hypothetical protein
MRNTRPSSSATPASVKYAISDSTDWLKMSEDSVTLLRNVIVHQHSTNRLLHTSFVSCLHILMLAHVQVHETGGHAGDGSNGELEL